MQTPPAVVSFPEETRLFFERLSEFMELPLYFYGSIQRWDYLPGCSDVDVAMFTPHMENAVIQLQSYFDIPREKIKRIQWRLDGHTIRGYKVHSTEGELSFDISLFHEKDKRRVLRQYKKEANRPLWVLFVLLLLKYIYYYGFGGPTGPWKTIYVNTKNMILNNGNTKNPDWTFSSV